MGKDQGSFKYDGTDFSWRVERGMITVSDGVHSKTTQLGGSAGAPELLAKIIAKEFKASEGNG